MIFSIDQEKIKEEHLKEVLEKIGKKKNKIFTLRMTEAEHTTFKAKSKFLNQSLSMLFIEAEEQLKAPGFSEIKKQVEEIYKMEDKEVRRIKND